MFAKRSSPCFNGATMPSSTVQSRLILGIDPGFDRCGWAILERVGRQDRVVAADTWTTNRRQSKLERLHDLQRQVQQVVKQWQPQEMAIEELYFSRNVSTALPVSEARGIILGVAFEHELSVFEYQPSAIKLAVTGYGRANKQQVTDMVVRLLKLEKSPKIDDTGDAIAVALAHAAQPRTT